MFSSNLGIVTEEKQRSEKDKLTKCIFFFKSLEAWLERTKLSSWNSSSWVCPSHQSIISFSMPCSWPCTSPLSWCWYNAKESRWPHSGHRPWPWAAAAPKTRTTEERRAYSKTSPDRLLPVPLHNRSNGQHCYHCFGHLQHWAPQSHVLFPVQPGHHGYYLHLLWYFIYF